MKSKDSSTSLTKLPENSKAFFKELLKHISVRWIFILFLVQISASLFPAVSVWSSSLFISKVASTSTGSLPLFESTIFLVVIFCVAEFSFEAAAFSLSILNDVLAEKISLFSKSKLMQRVSDFHTLAIVDDNELREKLLIAQQASEGLNQAIGQLSYVLASSIQILSAIVMVSVVSWVAPPLLLAITLPMLLARFYYETKSWNVRESFASSYMQADLYSQILLKPEYSKETRLWKIQKSLLSKWQVTSQSILDALNTIRKQGWLTVIILSIISAAGLFYLIFLLTKEDSSNSTFAFTLAFGSLIQLRSALGALVYNIGDAYQCRIYIKSLFSFLYEKNAPGRIEALKTLSEESTNSNQGILFQNLSFRYPGVKEHTIDNLTLHIGSGSTIAIVGENGSGKSTLMKLLAGLYLPSEGALWFENKQLCSLNISEWRNDISAVFQDYARFPLTVRNNLDIKNVGYSNEELIDILHKVGLSQLQDKLDSQVGAGLPDGIELSGGQWQKLAIARAILALKTSKVLLLDEPSSALDPESEHDLLQELRQASRGKTIIIITHRLALTKAVDEIFVLSQGKIIESGSHEDLMKTQGAYRRMFDKQTSLFT